MGLRSKFNSSILTVFLAGLCLAAGLVWRVTRNDAGAELIHDAQVIAAQAAAIRGYTVDEIQPLLGSHDRDRFLPQSIPAFAATTTLRDFTRRFPGYTYKEAALNPTNPSDQAIPDEAEIIARFRGNAALTNIVSTRDSPAGPVLSIFRPIRIENKDCLACHSTPAAAPPAMLDVYGAKNGFGWNLNEVIGAQIVSVPMDGAVRRANARLVWFVVGLSAILAAVMMWVNALLSIAVIRPVRAMSALATEVVECGTAASEFPATGGDEISSLGKSLNRLRRTFATNLSEEWGDQAAFAKFGIARSADLSDFSFPQSGTFGFYRPEGRAGSESTDIGTHGRAETVGV